jgi:hypothetical protein
MSLTSADEKPRRFPPLFLRTNPICGYLTGDPAHEKSEDEEKNETEIQARYLLPQLLIINATFRLLKDFALRKTTNLGRSVEMCWQLSF